MSVNTNFFANLRNQYPKASDLLHYLQSDAGGNLRVIQSNATTISHLALIRYVKGHSDMTNPNVPYFRSVVWNTETNLPVAIAPFKSYKWESYSPTDSIVVEDFWDGTMLNMFFDTRTNMWMLATRSNIGARCRFFSEKSFGELFWTTFQQNGLTMNQLDASCTYTWVLQHPENRIVVPVSTPVVRLVQVYRISEIGQFVPAYEKLDPTLVWTLPRRLPLIGHEATKDALRSIVMASNNIYCQGLVVKDLATGNRWKVRTPIYNVARALRGNTPRRDFLWLDAKSKGQLKNYLSYYPEETQASADLWNRLCSETRVLYDWYNKIYKARSHQMKAAPLYLSRMLNDMHDNYLNVLKPAQQTMTWEKCVQWVNTQDVPRLLYIANYQHLKKQPKQQVNQDVPFEPTDSNLMDTSD